MDWNSFRRNMKEFQVHGGILSLALFTDVTNSEELLDAMQAGTLELELAFLNASVIPDIFPVLAAAHKTLVAKSKESLKTYIRIIEEIWNL